MEDLIKLVSTNEDWILKRVVDYAKIHEYTRYTSTLIEAWRISLTSLNAAMQHILKTGEPILTPSLGDSFNETALDRFSIEEVHKHRARGVTLAMFLGLVKYYRLSYLDLVREQNFDVKKEREYLTFLEQFFDRFEIGYSVEWNALNASQAADELRSQNRALTNEKNKYLTIFESLYDPVILLDANNNIENINQAAAELFQAHDLPGHRYYDQHPADQAFPWLAQEIAIFSHSLEQELIVVKTLQTRQGERHFQVKMKRMLDVSEKYRGIVLILNDLTERVKKEEAITLNRAIQKWVHTLVDLSQRISSNLETDSILTCAMEALYNLTLPDAAALGLWDADAGVFNVQYLVSTGGVEKVDFDFFPSGQAQTVTDAPKLFPRLSGAMAQMAEISLDSDEQKIGRLWIARMDNAAFTPSETLIFESIAQQMAIAIEHALMTAQIQSGAIVEERARLAREMHDGLSQILGFLSLEMQSLELLIGQGKIGETLAELAQARKRIREAQAEVRENIINLRSALSKDGEAVPFLCEYIQEFGQQTGIEVHVECDDLPRASLTPICEVQLVRIVQEALTNVRLHAQANHLWAHFERKDGTLCVQIRDDGIGFVEQTLKKHFGLKSMRERTESVRGRLIIDSKPEAGTCISPCLPLTEQKVSPRQEATYGQTTAA